MNIQVQSTVNKFGKKMLELLDILKTTENWEEYVEPVTINLIKDLLEFKNLSAVMEKNDIPYISLRSKYLIALKRIKAQKKNHIRNGKSEKAQNLISLIESTPNWKDILTEREISYTENFLKLKNFYEVGRQLDVAPSNVAGTLYGTTQRTGVIDKIENYKTKIKELQHV